MIGGQEEMDLKSLNEKQLIEAYFKSDRKLRDKIGTEIYERHKPMICKFSMKFEDSLKSEAKSVATEVMFKLLNKFELSKQTKFSTYFCSHLNYLKKDIYRRNFPYTISDYTWKQRNKETTATRELMSQIRSREEKKALPESTKMDYLSLEWQEVTEKLKKILAECDHQENSILSMYFGLNGEKHTKKEIAEKMEISSYAVSKILQKILDKISQKKSELYIPD